MAAARSRDGCGMIPTRRSSRKKGFIDHLCPANQTAYRALCRRETFMLVLTCSYLDSSVKRKVIAAVSGVQGGAPALREGEDDRLALLGGLVRDRGLRDALSRGLYSAPLMALNPTPRLKVA